MLSAAGVLNIGYVDAGDPRGAPVVLLHGWPYDIHLLRCCAVAHRYGLSSHRVLLATSVLVTSGHADGDSALKLASPIYGVTIPDGYRQWEFVAPALESAPLNELRAVVGNKTATGAYRKSTLAFPDGTILVKLAWQQKQSTEFAPATVPGAATTVQVMVKDSKKYAATGGWGFGRFINGKPVDEGQHQTCFACHEARAKSRDYVFTRYAE